MKKRVRNLVAIRLQGQVELLTEALLESGTEAAKEMAAAVMSLALRAEEVRKEDHLASMNAYPDLTPWCEDEECVMGVWQNKRDIDPDAYVDVATWDAVEYDYVPEGQGVSIEVFDHEGALVEARHHPAHKDTSYVRGSGRMPANDAGALAHDNWERESFLDYRRPLGSAFQPGYDWQHGYRLDPRWVANESRMEREYGPMRIEEVRSHVVDPWTGSLVTNADGSLLVEVEEVPRAGSATWEYERRCKKVPFRKAKDKRSGLPWIGTKMLTADIVKTADGFTGVVAFRYSTPWTEVAAVNIGGVEYHYATRNVTVLKEGRWVPTPAGRKQFAWIMAQERGDDTPALSYDKTHRRFVWKEKGMVKQTDSEVQREQQRKNIIALAKMIGRDPKSPTFGAWVKEQGYVKAQARLLAAVAAAQA